MAKSREDLLWPAAIIFLLVSSVVMMMAVLVAANSDGGAQVVDDYYKSAVEWDVLKARVDQSDALHWSITFSISSADADHPLTGFFVVNDSTGRPVVNVQGSIKIRQPHRSADEISFDLSHDPTSPGFYTFPFPEGWRGLTDVMLDGISGDLPIHYRTRVER